MCREVLFALPWGCDLDAADALLDEHGWARHAPSHPLEHPGLATDPTLFRLENSHCDCDHAIGAAPEMKGKAKAAKYDGPILFVKGDKKTDYGRVRVVMEWIKELNVQDIALVVERAEIAGVALKWFGAADPVGFTSRTDHWRYADEQSVPNARDILATTLDMRIPLTMTQEQADLIVAAIAAALRD